MRLGSVLAVLLLAAAAANAAPLSVKQDGAQAAITIAAGSETEREIKTVAVSARRLTDRIDATATIEPDPRLVAKITPRIRARVVRLIAEPGQTVAAAQALAILNSIELGQAKVEYLKARSLEEIAQRHLRREQRLHAQKISSEKDLLEAEAAHDTALAHYKSALETLRLMVPRLDMTSVSWSQNSHSLSDFALTSPIGGILVKRDLVMGQIVGGDDVVMEVIDLSRVIVLAMVFEHDVAALEAGQSARIFVDAYPGRVFTGTIAYVSAVVDPKTRTVQARIDIPNAAHLLKPGMFARVAIATASKEREALSVPASALFDVDGQTIVFVKTGPRSFVARAIVTGRRGANEVEIQDGLASGDQVVVAGGLLLKAMVSNKAGG